MNESAKFEVIYDGPALKNSEMDVKELAPALVAIADLIEETNRVVNKGKTRILVKIKGGVKSGSIGIELVLAQAVDLLTSSEVDAGFRILELLGLAYGIQKVGLAKLLQWLKKRVITKITTLENGKVQILVNNDSVEVEKEVLELLKNIQIRQNFETAITNPLSNEGIDNFRTEFGNKEFLNIAKNEKECFVAPPIEDDLISEIIFSTKLNLVSITFLEGNKWKFSDGSAVFFAEIKDDTFIDRVQNNEEIFAKDDILSVKLRKVQWNTIKGLKTEYEVLNVFDHKQPHLQIKLPIEENKDK